MVEHLVRAPDESKAREKAKKEWKMKYGTDVETANVSRVEHPDESENETLYQVTLRK